MRKNWDQYKFEFLLFALLNLIYNKIFFPDNPFYTQYIWPTNMVVLGVASAILFKNRRDFLSILKNLLLFVVVLTPFLSKYIFVSQILSLLVLLVYISFYSIIFYEVLKQITFTKNINVSVILGSFCGYFVLTVIAIFTFLIADLIFPNSLKGVEGLQIPDRYNQISYFTQITLSSIGYGDISPAIDSTRLMSAFWGIVGQFYLIAIVGIIISKYSSNNKL